MTTCPECGERLVSGLPGKRPVAEPVDRSWLAVCAVERGVRADMAQGALDSVNIPSTITARSFNAPSATRQTGPQQTDPPGLPRVVMVPREFYEDAVIILQDVLGNDFVQIESS
ncbi:hypothetical protein GF420_08645 [candidate division GN15 bacterium]|jgi:hypothetical protein|nr:hypothetical protein [candidate division GN15 bacterium]